MRKIPSKSSIAPIKADKAKIPKGRKVGVIIGYHHLEKPWGQAFMNMFRQQIMYSPNQIEFILIDNKEIPTGDRSLASEREVQRVVQEKGITHLIDVHEQLSMLNHYMDSQFKKEWKEGGEKNPAGKECTLDPFVPLWTIEQYYRGIVNPQFQHAVNDQLQKVVNLIQEIK